MAIIMPVVLLIISAVAQVISWEFARQAVQQSADLGVEAARLHGATASDGATAAADSARRFHSLHAVAVTVSRPQVNTVKVDVTATTAAVVPGLSIEVHGSAVAPVEPGT